MSAQVPANSEYAITVRIDDVELQNAAKTLQEALFKVPFEMKDLDGGITKDLTQAAGDMKKASENMQKDAGGSGIKEAFGDVSKSLMGSSGMGGIMKALGPLMPMLAVITGLSLSVVSIVNLITSSSKVLGSSLEIFQNSITMIFRPIGDFIGFLLRPLMIQFMTMFAIPFYQEMFPIMRQAGNFMGDTLVKFFQDPIASIRDWYGGLPWVMQMVPLFATVNSIAVLLEGIDWDKAYKDTKATLDTLGKWWGEQMLESQKLIKAVQDALEKALNPILSRVGMDPLNFENKYTYDQIFGLWVEYQKRTGDRLPMSEFIEQEGLTPDFSPKGIAGSEDDWINNLIVKPWNDFITWMGTNAASGALIPAAFADDGGFIGPLQPGYEIDKQFMGIEDRPSTMLGLYEDAVGKTGEMSDNMEQAADNSEEVLDYSEIMRRSMADATEALVAGGASAYQLRESLANIQNYFSGLSGGAIAPNLAYERSTGGGAANANFDEYQAFIAAGGTMSEWWAQNSNFGRDPGSGAGGGIGYGFSVPDGATAADYFSNPDSFYTPGVPGGHQRPSAPTPTGGYGPGGGVPTHSNPDGNLAEGGLINEMIFGVGQSGKTYMFGEGGESEYIVPRHKLLEPREGGGKTVNNSVTMSVFVDKVINEHNVRDLSETLTDMMQEKMHYGGI